MNSLGRFICLFCILPVCAHGQFIRTAYYDANWKPVAERRYAIKRVVTKTDSVFVMTDFTKKGQLLFSGEYASIDPDVEHGHFKFYNDKGLLKAKGNYTDGEMSGKWDFYGEDESLKKQIDFEITSPVCTAVDTVGKFLSFEAVDSSQVESMPVFPGGSDAYYKFLYDRLIYPPLAAMYYKTGRVIGKFTIDEEGRVCDVYTEDGVDKDLRKETIRVIMLMPQWEPGKVGDKPVVVKFTIPMLFEFK